MVRGPLVSFFTKIFEKKLLVLHIGREEGERGERRKLLKTTNFFK